MNLKTKEWTMYEIQSIPLSLFILAGCGWDWSYTSFGWPKCSGDHTEKIETRGTSWSLSVVYYASFNICSNNGINDSKNDMSFVLVWALDSIFGFEFSTDTCTVFTINTL